MIEIWLKGVKWFGVAGDNVSVVQSGPRGNDIVRLLKGRDCDVSGYVDGDYVDVKCLLGQKDGKRYFVIATEIRDAQ